MTALVVLSGCSAAPAPSEDGRVQVVASTNVYGQIAEQIGGERVSVTSIINSGSQDPHSYESTARDQLAVQRAQLVIENGGGFDRFIDALLGAVSNDPIVITAVEFSPSWPAGPHVEEEAHDEHAHEHEHDHVEGFNEHVWFDPATMILLAERIAADLSELDAAGAEEFTANATGFAAELEGVQAQVAAIAADHAGEGVFLTEPLAGYLVAGAELVDVAPPGFAEAVEAGRDVSPAVLLASLRAVESGEARAVLLNGQTAGAETKRIMDAATDADVPIVAFTETLPGGSAGASITYADWMSDNVERLATALSA